MAMFQDIDNVVKTSINKNKQKFTKKELIVYYSIKNPGFNEIVTNLLKYDWLKYKRLSAIINIIKQYIALYIK